MNNAEKEKLNKEAEAIYKLLMASEKEAAEPVFKDIIVHPQTGRLAIRWIGIPLVLTIPMFISYLICHHVALKVIISLLLLISSIGFLFISILEMFSGIKKILPEIKELYNNPLIPVFNSMINISSQTTFIYLKLRGFSLEALHLTKVMIEERQKGIVYRLALLIGAFDKFGLLPVLASQYFAATTTGKPKLALGLAIGMSFLYLLAFIIHDALPRLGFYLQLLELEIDRRSRSEQ
ncbi:MAG: hypothetical protein D3904_05095 [Candidatus Electrothrix sp. EH2]|nr:hypothetical protein [Candidatus Electrothrix sp. EH2]